MLIAQDNVNYNETENTVLERFSGKPATAFHVRDVTYRAPKSKINLCEGRFTYLKIKRGN